MMVLEKKPVEKNRNILGQKQRKVSKSSKQICSPAYGNGPPLFPTELDPPPDPVVSWVQNLQAPPPLPAEPAPRPPPCRPPEGPPVEAGGQESVSMESMVSLACTDLQAHYRAGLHHLRTGQFKDSIKSLEKVKKAVEEQPSFGEYAIYKRTKNKRTTLSALSMFLGLAWEGLASPRKAIECCCHSIQQDPGWPVPFTKRAEYFSLFEQLLLDTAAPGGEEALRARLAANILVEPGRPPGGEPEGAARAFSDLQEALSAAVEGDVVLIQPGFYYREEGFTVHVSCSLLGAGPRGVQLVSRGAPTLQVCCTGPTGRSRIHLQRLQFRNKLCAKEPAVEAQVDASDEEETMKSSAAHLYIISASSVTIKDCLFPGGAEGAGGVLVAEEAFYQSLLDLECQNPELRGSSGGVEGGNLRLLIDFCIFSDIRLNAAVHSNNQAVVVLSNCEVRDCGGPGLRAEEGSTLNLLNCQVSSCGGDCVAVDTLSTLAVRGCLIAGSGARGPGRGDYHAGIALAGKSKGTVTRSLMRRHPSAVSCLDSDLVLEESCVMDIGLDSSSPGAEGTGGAGNLELRHSAVYVRRGGSVTIQRNNFHNCNLVFLLQHGAAPAILDNNVETCLIGFICGSRALARIERNIFHCVLMSIGMFIEDSRGSVVANVFQYVANGLDVHRGSAPRLQANTYTSLAVPGLSGSLSFDIQRVHSGRLEELEAAEIITFSADTDEAVAAAALCRRQATQERERPCPCCGQVRARPTPCTRCGQIFYCSAACLARDQARHRAFCGISLKDMF